MEDAPPPRRARHQVLLAGCAGLAVLLALLGGAFAVRRFGGNGAVEPTVSLVHGGTLLSTPRHEWRLSADDVAPGLSPTSQGSPDSQIDLIATQARTLTVTVESSRGTAMAGVDAATGQVLWRIRDDPYVECRSVLDKTRLACIGGPRGSSYDILDPATGAVVKRLRLPGGGFPLAVTWHADTLFVISSRGAGRTADLEAHAFSGSDFAPLWSQTLRGQPFSDGAEVYRGDQVYSAAGHGFLAVDYGPFSFHVAISDGRLLARYRGGVYSGLDLWPTDYLLTLNAEQTTTRVTDLDGRQRLRAAGGPWSGPDVEFNPVVHGDIGIGDTLYDLSTGRPVWSRPDLAGRLESWSADRNVILAGDGEHTSGQTLLDPRTGRTWWRSPTYLDGYNCLFTRDAAVIGDPAGDVTVRDKQSGAVAWSWRLPPVFDLTREFAWQGIESTDDALIVAGVDYVVGFSGFTAIPA